MTDQTVKFAIAGVAGRMGRELAKSVLEARHSLTGGTERPDSPDRDIDIAVLAGRTAPLGLTPVSDAVNAAAGAHVFIDFTSPQATLSALASLQHTTVRAVIIGTTGFSAAEEAQISAASSAFAIVKAGNFSLGVNLACAITRIAARRLGTDWDVDVLETHHRRKVDAPSGTALMLGEAVAQGRGADLNALRRAPYDGTDAARSEGEIGFAVRRLGGVVGAHEVSFASEREVLSISHDALDRGVFADGALAAALWAVSQPPGLYNMDDVLGLRGLSAS
ncbi:MAG: 4-hydroxy-tetrahydrodipicolinate reductase [Pseudomonadota bacterium]